MAEAAIACIPFCCQAFKLTMDMLVNLEVKIRQNDLSVNQDIRDIMDNMHKYSKKDQKKLWAYVKKICDMNMSFANTVKNSVIDNRSIIDDEKETT